MVEIKDIKKPAKKKRRDNKSKKKSFQTIASNRINELFHQAEKLFYRAPKYANNCVVLARKISLRYKVPFSKEQKILYCKRCGSYLKPGKTSRIRVSRGKIVVLCNSCKHLSRYAYK